MLRFYSHDAIFPRQKALGFVLQLVTKINLPPLIIDCASFCWILDNNIRIKNDYLC